MTMRRLFSLLRERRGAGAVEFALAAPIFIFLVNGVAQLGILFIANAVINNALAEGARYATIHPQPTDAQIEAKINGERWGLDGARLDIAPPARGAANGSPYIELRMTYDVNLNFIFFDIGPVELTQSRRVYLYS